MYSTIHFGTPRNAQKEINAELKKSVIPGVTVVDESLPFGNDTDPTLPMNADAGLSASVEGLLRRDIEGEDATPRYETEGDQVWVVWPCTQDCCI